MATWGNSYGTSATTEYFTADVVDYNSKPKKKERSGWMFHSKTFEKISKIKELKGTIAVFAFRKSPAFNDRAGLEYRGISTYYNDPVVLGYDSPTKLAFYNFAIIIDALEYMPNKMSRANLIKEALATLKPRSKNPYLLVLAKTPKMVEELVKSNGYKETDNGFLIPEKKGERFGGLTIQGLDVDNLIDMAYFAGAEYIEEDILIETDLACIRIYLHKQG
jgi:hypothetical protein